MSDEAEGPNTPGKEGGAPPTPAASTLGVEAVAAGEEVVSVDEPFAPISAPAQKDASAQIEVPADVENPHNHTFRNFIFFRELAEVYLLLDNLSSSLAKRIPPPRPADINKKDPGEPDWIGEICKIGWPPEGSDAKLDGQAATLMRARDRLNTLADPASGYTIAFTSLVSEQLNRTSTRDRQSGKNHGKGPCKDAQQAPDSPTPLALVGVGWPESNVPSRFALANIAYPGLVTPAVRFYHFTRLLLFGLAALFIATSLLSWNVAVGNSLLGQLKALELDAPNAKTLSPPKTSVSNAILTRAANAVNTNNPAAASTVADSCEPGSTCHKISDAQYNLRRWSDSWRWTPFWGGQNDLSCSPVDAECDPDNELWINTFLGVLGGAVLPILYGVIGAGVAVIRSLSDRVKEDRLAPRHKTLFQVQLVLGAILGGCIGIFATPPNTQGAGVLSAVPLSASALSFLAGFAVEGVFKALDSFIRRVFNLPDPSDPLVPPVEKKI